MYYFRCSTYTSFARLGLCTSHSIRMDYVENLVVNRIKEIIKNYSQKDNLIGIAKQKLNEEKNNDYKQKIEEYEKKVVKITLEIDNIYNDRLSGILQEDDFSRIYERKKQEKIQIQKRIEQLQEYIDGVIINDNEIIEKAIKKFNEKTIISRESLADLIEKIEIDENKKVYVYFKFKMLNDV